MTKSKKSTASPRTKRTPNFAQSAILGVLAIIVAVIAYKQIFLVNYITSSLPKDSLTRTIEVCVQENFAPKLLSSLKQNSLQPNNFNMQNVFNNVLRGISTNMVQTKVQNNYIIEMKVLKINDLFGKSAETRITGLIELISTIPVIGEIRSKKDYLLVLFKDDHKYYFNTFSVKDEKESQWQEWSCAKTL